MSTGEIWKDYLYQGLSLQQQGRYEEARSAYLAALAEVEQFGADDVRPAFVLANLASLYNDLNRTAEAEGILERTVPVLQKAFGPTHPNVAAALNTLGTGLREAGQVCTG